ncbi:MAG: polyprenyl synthetase family protein [Prevotellaceae bacterium]|jgi:octaprenyl-diphosphate synthase|nr:polyprenyl synthetase family protein [Prevotellaceae bacterium]
MTIHEIQNAVKDELRLFEPFFRQQLQSSVPMLSAITSYLYRVKGKQLRPLLVFLSAKVNGEVCQKTYAGAALMELLHTATLMHDDVVDEANERRNRLSIQALWDSKKAILSGDFLLSRGVLVALEHQSVAFLHIATNTIRDMSEGEMQQLARANRLEWSEEGYFDIIRKKTASLIQNCTAIGAHSVGAQGDRLAAIGRYGELLGVAFQLRDDVLDFHSSAFTGKACGNDIRERKITLPLIYALGRVGKEEQRRVLSLVATAKAKSQNVGQVTRFVAEQGGLAYTDEVAHRYCREAKQALLPFPDSEAKAALCGLADYVTERKK